MAKEIYSPIDLWRSFSLENRLLKKNIVECKKQNGYVVEKFFVEGIFSSRIFCKILYPDNAKKNKKLVLLLNDAGPIFSDEDLMTVSHGTYAVATVDFAGETYVEQEYATLYPEDLSYANFNRCKDKLRYSFKP